VHFWNFALMDHAISLLSWQESITTFCGILISVKSWLCLFS